MDEYVVTTGGAVGADTLAEELAKDHGMRVSLKLCPHQPQVSTYASHVSREELEQARPFVKTAAQRLDRQPSLNPFVQDLLARNHYIVKDALVVYVYAEFEDASLTKVKGGSGMTAQMCVEHNREHPDRWKDVFVFDETLGKWYQLDSPCHYDEDWEPYAEWSETLGHYEYAEVFGTPALSKKSAVVGSRTLGPAGRKMMRKQFATTVREEVRYLRAKSISLGAAPTDADVDMLCTKFEKLSIQDDEPMSNENEKTDQ